MKRLYITRLFLSALLFLSLIPISSAQYYWVGNGGNWSDYEHHWATTSGGETFHTSVPTTDDDVFFDENSFTLDDQTVIIDESAQTNNISWNVSHSPTFYGRGFAQNITIAGNAIFQENVDFDIEQYSFYAQDKTISITSNGADLGPKSSLRFIGNNTINLDDDIKAYQILLSNITLNTNDYNIDLDRNFSISGEANLSLGNSTITCDAWIVQNINYTLDAGTSTIIPTRFEDKIENLTSTPYNKVIFQNYGLIRTAANIKDVSVNITKNGAWLKFYGGAKLVCESLTANTDKSHPLELGLFDGTEFATIEKTSGTVNLDFVTIQDVHATGGATFNATGTDNGNTDGWNFSPIPPDNYYWVGDTGNWEDVSHWATSSGGSDFHTIPPTIYDNVFFDENSFSMENQQVTINEDLSIHSINSTGTQFSPTLLKSGGTLTVTGDVNIEDINTQMPNFKIVNADSASLKLGNNPYKFNVILEGGVFNINSDFLCTSFFVKKGTLNCNNHIMKMIDNFNSYGPSTLNLGSANITCNNFRINQNQDSVTLNAQNSTITCKKRIEGKNKTFNHVIFNGKLTVYDNNTFNTLEFAKGAEVQLYAGSIQTVLGDIIFNGTSSKNIYLSSTTDGATATLFKADGEVIGNYLVLKDNIATGGAIFTANQSIDLGNNTGWNITELMPRDFYWVGNNGKWSDINHWVTTSGGSTLHNDVPGLLDNVYFDANSFTVDNSTVVMGDEYSIHSLNCKGVTHHPKLTGSRLNVYGSLLLDKNMVAQIQYPSILGKGDHDLDMGDSIEGKTILTINTDGKINLKSALNVFRFQMDQGQLETNDFDILVENHMSFNTWDHKQLNLGTSTFESPIFKWVTNGDSLSIQGENATIVCDSLFSLRQYENDKKAIDINLQHLILKHDAIATLNTNFYADTLTIVPGKEVVIDPESDFTVGALLVKGTENDRIKIHSLTPNVAATIKKTTGIVDGQYLELKDLIGTGGASFHADHSIDLGNVTGWLFGPVATKNIQNFKTIGITPNPVVEHIHLDLPTGQSGIYEIYNTQGKIIQKNSFENTSNLSIEVNDLDSGIYFVLIQMGNDFFQGKFIKK